jgi:hypothetical protein
LTWGTNETTARTEKSSSFFIVPVGVVCEQYVASPTDWIPIIPTRDVIDDTVD